MIWCEVSESWQGKDTFRSLILPTYDILRKARRSLDGWIQGSMIPTASMESVVSPKPQSEAQARLKAARNQYRLHRRPFHRNTSNSYLAIICLPSKVDCLITLLNTISQLLDPIKSIFNFLSIAISYLHPRCYLSCAGSTLNSTDPGKWEL